eukprot:SAG31_NODE_552_length_14204_cov_14.295356_11_plen_183_part_00
MQPAEIYGCTFIFAGSIMIITVVLQSCGCTATQKVLKLLFALSITCGLVTAIWLMINVFGPWMPLSSGHRYYAPLRHHEAICLALSLRLCPFLFFALAIQIGEPGAACKDTGGKAADFQAMCWKISTAPFVYLLLYCFWALCVSPCCRCCCPCCFQNSTDDGEMHYQGRQQPFKDDEETSVN